MMSIRNVEGLEPEVVVGMLTSKPIHSLTEDDKAFLRARVDYLSEDQLDTYNAILKAKQKTERVEEVVTTEETVLPVLETETVEAEPAPKPKKAAK